MAGRATIAARLFRAAAQSAGEASGMSHLWSEPPAGWICNRLQHDYVALAAARSARAFLLNGIGLVVDGDCTLLCISGLIGDLEHVEFGVAEQGDVLFRGLPFLRFCRDVIGSSGGVEI